jgi:hypothetical protein
MDNSKILFALFFADSALPDICARRFRIFQSGMLDASKYNLNFSDTASVEAHGINTLP